MDLLTAILARNQSGKPLAYDEKASKTLIHEEGIVFEPNEELSGLHALAFPIDVPPLADIIGFTFTTVFGGVITEIHITEETATKNGGSWNDGSVFYGDLSILGLEGGYTTFYAIIIDTNQKTAVIAFVAERDIQILELECDYNKAVPIDPKYIPEPPTINLHDYGIEIIGFCANGGGHLVLNDEEKAKAFTHDVKTKRPQYVLCNDMVGKELRIAVNACTHYSLGFSLGVLATVGGNAAMIATNTAIVGYNNRIELYSTVETQVIS